MRGGGEGFVCITSSAAKQQRQLSCRYVQLWGAGWTKNEVLWSLKHGVRQGSSAALPILIRARILTEVKGASVGTLDHGTQALDNDSLNLSELTHSA